VTLVKVFVTWGVTTTSTLGRRPSRPSAISMSKAPPLYRSVPGHRGVPPLTGGIDVEEDFSGNGEARDFVCIAIICS
jgi:hypothetical protein